MLNSSLEEVKSKTITAYKTTSYNGTTSGTNIKVAEITLPKGKYIPISSGYCSYYGAWINDIDYVNNITLLTLDAEKTIYIYSPTSSQVEWIAYSVTFLKIE